MFRIWGKVFKENRLIKQVTITDSSKDTRTHKVYNSLEKICHEFDLSNPIWLDKNIREFKKFSKTRFNNDNFIENIDFDFLEIHMLEEDEFWE